MIPEFLEPAFMQRALLAAVLVGLAAPAVGTYLVQRRLALMGDGIGHVALTGVALGFLVGAAPVLTAVIVAVAGALLMELIRERGRTSGDVALAILFYGGIAGGVLLIGLAAVILAVAVGLRRALFALCQDEEYARVAGLPVRWLNVLIAVMAALTVTVAMRVVGLLLVSALMVVPVATAQQLARSFKATMFTALGIGVLVAVAGVVFSYYVDVAPGASIVVIAIGGFLVVTVVSSLRGRVPSMWGRPTVEPTGRDEQRARVRGAGRSDTEEVATP